MLSFQQLINQGKQALLPYFSSEHAQKDSWWLMRSLIADSPHLAARLQEEVRTSLAKQFVELIRQRSQGKPVSRIMGYRSFYGHAFQITSNVLDPRADSETVVEAALHFPFKTVLDLGTGSGCLLLSILYERPQSQGIAVDICPKALIIARKNAEKLGLSNRCHFIQSDWFTRVQGYHDLIVSNPPYIAHSTVKTLAPEIRDYDPLIALSPGQDSYGAYRAIFASAKQYLAPKGHLLLEIGDGMAKKVIEMALTAGFDLHSTHNDLTHQIRTLCFFNDQLSKPT